MHLLDINVWLALVFEVHTHHKNAVAWFNTAEKDSVAFCRLTQQGFLRLATNNTIFSDAALNLTDAWRCYDMLLDDERVCFLNELPGLEDCWRKHTKQRSKSHHVWNDAYLIAFAETADIELVTFENGFSSYNSNDLQLRILAS
ncbi:MAG: PIN domain-containing protein [Deltaproteobacteria bacterium]|nr:PIN domain-containing protein [Deltaproteobacteria bacterium]